MRTEKTKYLFLYTIAITCFSLFAGCNQFVQKRVPNEQQIIADYGSYPFTDWVNWSVSYREGAGYYLACNQHGDSFDKILFMRKDSIVVVIPSITESGKNVHYSLNELSYSGIWDQRYPEADFATFSQLAYFITNNGLKAVHVNEDVVRIEGNDFEICKKLQSDGFINDTYFVSIGNGWYRSRK